MLPPAEAAAPAPNAGAKVAEASAAAVGVPKEANLGRLASKPKPPPPIRPAPPPPPKSPRLLPRLPRLPSVPSAEDAAFGPRTGVVVDELPVCGLPIRFMYWEAVCHGAWMLP